MYLDIVIKCLSLTNLKQILQSAYNSGWMKQLRLLLFFLFSILLLLQVGKFAIKLISPSKVNSVVTKSLVDGAAPIITICQEGNN